MAKKVLSTLDLTDGKIENLPTPTLSGDAAPKGYVDTAIATAISNMAWKDAVRVASTANVNTASPGATHDGVSLTANDRILLKDQTTPSENGVWIYNGAAVALTRATDFDASAEIEGAVIPVEEGTANAATRWYLTTQNPVIGSTLAFANLASGAPNASETTAGLIELATQAEVNTGADALRAVTPATLTSWTGRVKKYSQSVGNGALTQIDVTHSLGTTDVHVQCFLVSTGAGVEVEWTALNTTTVRLNFLNAPAASAIRVVVLA